MVASRIHEHAGVEPKLGKFQIWSKGGGPEPEGIDELLEGAPRPADPIWTGDLEAERNGMVILGTPVGSPEFVQRFLGDRLDVQTRFWDRLKQVLDLQAAWLLLLYCAVPPPDPSDPPGFGRGLRPSARRWHLGNFPRPHRLGSATGTRPHPRGGGAATAS